MNCKANYERRLELCRTWVTDLQDIPYYFIIGEKSSSHPHILAVDCDDANLPMKLYLAYKICFERERFDYVFTCDDDTYVVVDRLLNCGFEKYDYMGHIYKSHAEGGAGFFLSRRAIEEITSFSPNDPLISQAIASDTMVGNLCHASKVVAHHDNRFKQGYSSEKKPDPVLPHPDNNVITGHYLNREQFRQIYQSFHPEKNMFLL